MLDHCIVQTKAPIISISHQLSNYMEPRVTSCVQRFHKVLLRGYNWSNLSRAYSSWDQSLIHTFDCTAHLPNQAVCNCGGAGRKEVEMGVWQGPAGQREGAQCGGQEASWGWPGFSPAAEGSGREVCARSASREDWKLFMPSEAAGVWTQTGTWSESKIILNNDWKHCFTPTHQHILFKMCVIQSLYLLVYQFNSTLVYRTMNCINPTMNERYCIYVRK